MTVTGKVNVAGIALAEDTLLDGEQWLELEADAKVSLRHSLTSREFQVLGPARVLPCRRGTEVVLLAAGRLSTSAGLGVRPGAEVIIATPRGAIHYGDAALDVELTKQALAVRVKQGQAFVEPEADGKPRFTNPVSSGHEAHLVAPLIAVSARVATCEASAEAAKGSAERVIAAAPVIVDGGSLGDRAALQMRNRSKARTDCALANVAIAALADTPELRSLSAAVAHAEQVWQTVPRFVRGRNN